MVRRPPVNACDWTGEEAGLVEGGGRARTTQRRRCFPLPVVLVSRWSEVRSLLRPRTRRRGAFIPQGNPGRGLGATGRPPRSTTGGVGAAWPPLRAEAAGSPRLPPYLLFTVTELTFI
ncbi:hypothetical protein NDU88_009086 [Pleurodeles waltl]|uniref:Uncharacterized protein n=1 Tax=Pleurodeles waltl TaxID=8319 RepID=A0AAV7RYR3_PLEWA|nr:hypothetical protein NDU88_009086 [Pleurodeles waltl]